MKRLDRQSPSRSFGGAAEHLLSGGVEQHDPLFLVDGDDCIHRRLYDATQTFLALSQFLLDLLALRDIRGNGEHAWFIRNLDEFRRTEANSFASIFAAKSSFKIPNGTFGAKTFHEFNPFLGIHPELKVEGCAPNHLISLPAGDLFEGLIDIEIAMVIRAGQGKSHRALPKSL